VIRRIVENFRRLSRNVLGRNARNIDFVLPLNPPALLPNADDKLRTKALLEERGVPVPETLAVFESRIDLWQAGLLLECRRGFVLKPARGAAGRGILVVRYAAGGFFAKDKNKEVRITDDLLCEHIEKILAGCFALERSDDKAYAEELLTPDPALAALSPGGLPDVRVLVLDSRPVMAMLRAATLRSRGKANLHEGGIGIGIELSSGRTTHAVWKGKQVRKHPDTGDRLDGVKIPAWQELKELAVRAASATGLRFVGVDVAVDEKLGPVVLEVNARPGLSIQLANMQGLRGLLQEASRP